MAIYYAFQLNPKFENIVTHRTAYNTFLFIGMNVYSMSCSGIVVAIETNMREPKKFPLVLSVGKTINFLFILIPFAISASLKQKVRNNEDSVLNGCVIHFKKSSRRKQYLLISSGS